MGTRFFIATVALILAAAPVARGHDEAPGYPASRASECITSGTRNRPFLTLTEDAGDPYEACGVCRWVLDCPPPGSPPRASAPDLLEDRFRLESTGDFVPVYALCADVVPDRCPSAQECLRTGGSTIEQRWRERPISGAGSGGEVRIDPVGGSEPLSFSRYSERAGRSNDPESYRRWDGHPGEWRARYDAAGPPNTFRFLNGCNPGQYYCLASVDFRRRTIVGGREQVVSGVTLVSCRAPGADRCPTATACLTSPDFSDPTLVPFERIVAPAAGPATGGPDARKGR